MQAVIAPHEIVNDESVLLLQWLVKDGEQVQQGNPLVTIETSKATMDIEAPVAGYVRFDIPKGTEVKVGGVLCFITDNPTDPIPETAERPKETANVSLQQRPSLPLSAAATRFSAQAATLMKQHGLTEEQFAGKGLVTAQDVLNLLDGQQPPEAQMKSVSNQGSVRSEELPRRKRLEAKLLMAGQNAVKSLVSVICSTRGLKAAAQTHPELRGGPLPLILYEAARLLRKYPIFNAFYEESNAHYYEVSEYRSCHRCGARPQSTRAGERRSSDDRGNQNGSRKLYLGLSGRCAAGAGLRRRSFYRDRLIRRGCLFIRASY